MNWEKITSAEFEEARAATEGVCLLPMGVLEKHGDNLPLGQDALYAHAVCTSAGEIEKAMVFPFYYFGQIAEARHQPGTFSIDITLQLALLEQVCDEISRNGFHKIIIVNAHGGNHGLLDAFFKSLLNKEKPYMVYEWFLCDRDDIKEHFASQIDGHAGEYEISQMYAVHPELVKNEGLPGDYGKPLKRLQEFTDLKIKSPVGWYSNYPGHFCGDQVPGSVEKGKIAFTYERDHLVRIIQKAKSDNTPLELYKEFHERARNPHCVKK